MEPRPEPELVEAEWGGQPQNGDQAAPAGDEAESILAGVRAEREKLAAERHFDHEVPGLGGRIVLRLGPLPGGTLGRMRQRMEQSRDPDRDVNLNADVLIAACKGVWGRRLELGLGLQELGDEHGPYLLDQRLGQALNMQATTARGVVFDLFRGANSPNVAIMMAASAYMDWAAGADEEVAAELLGES